MSLKKKLAIALLAPGVILSSCTEKSYYEIPAFSGEYVNVVVEIPAGENLKLEYDPESNKFSIEEIDGKPRSVAFLPYPGNYGFIPSTLMDKAAGGDGDALDVLIISKRIETKTVVETIPLGIMKLLDRGEEDDKVLAIPRDEALRISDCTTLECFRENHPGLIEIVEQWFQHYKGEGKMEFVETLGADQVMGEIKKWAKTNPAE